MNESFASVPLSHVDQMSFTLRILSFMKGLKTPCFYERQKCGQIHMT